MQQEMNWETKEVLDTIYSDESLYSYCCFFIRTEDNPEKCIREYLLGGMFPQSFYKSFDYYDGDYGQINFQEIIECLED